MDGKRGASRKIRLSVDTENSGERYYSALGGDPTFSGIFDRDVTNRRSQRSERIRFQDPESIILDDLQMPYILSQGHQTQEDPTSESRFYISNTDEEDSNEREIKRRGSEVHRSIFDSIEEWQESEISSTFKGLPPLQIQVLEGCWKGQMDRVHDAVVKTKESRKGQNYAHLIINHRDSLGRTPLHLASAFGHSQIVQFLILEGASINVWDKMNKVTPLGCACACGSLPVIEILLAHKADINAGIGRCLTPLHWTIKNGSEACLRKLLSAGANPNSVSVDVGTPLHLAAAHSTEKCIQILLENGASVTMFKGGDLSTALHIAATDGSPECVELLLQSGADIEAKDGREQTALHISANNGDSDVTAILLTYKSNTAAKDCDGRTPLHKAVSKGYDSAECLLLLLEYSADIDAQDNHGHTPLHLAAINDSSFAASFLLQQGADVTVRSKSGQSALSLLVKKMPHVIRHIRESLDNSVTLTNIDPTDPDCELKLDFRAMIANPSNKPSTNSQRSKANVPNSTERQTVTDDMQRETEFLNCLIRTGYKSYLSHPLVEAFIVLKWQRVRVFFWISLIFYVFTVLLYSIYVYEVYVEQCPFNLPEIKILENSNNSLGESIFIGKCQNLSTKLTNREKISMNSVYCELKNNLFVKIVWFLLAFMSVVISMKELFQMIQGFRAYFLSFEHYFQWLLLASIFMSLWPIPKTPTCLDYSHYPCAAIGILIAWSLMLVRIGRFPALGIYVQMLVKVIQNFGLFISAYACLIIAFAFAFTILFHDEPPFSSIQRSILKTVTMMVGELNYDDLFYQKVRTDGTEHEELKELNYPITAHILFGGFVVFMTIIMMNLLVGLAVHDIQSLEKGAKVERLLRQTSSIAGLELFLFSKGLHALLPNSIGKFLRKRALLVPSSYKWTFYFRPNDPRDRRLPKDLIREALCLASSRQKLGKRPSSGKTRHTVRAQNTFRLGSQLENMEIRLREGYKRDLESILTQIRQISSSTGNK